MKKFTYIVLTYFVTQFLTAQVGIGTNDPKSILDISATNASNPTITDGLLIPEMSSLPTTNPTADQDGMLIFLNTNIASYKKGHYYWNNATTTWESYGGEWRDGYDEDTEHLVFANQASKMDNEVVIFDNGSMGMGTRNPSENLELKFTGANHGIQVTSASPPNAPNIIFYTKNDVLSGGDFLNDEDPIGGVSAKTWSGSQRSQEIANIVFKADGDHSSGDLPTKYDISVTGSGDDSEDDSGVELTIKSNGNVGLGETTPTAVMHIKGGTASVNSAPIKLAAGTNLTSTENGAIEFDGSSLYFTPNAIRKQILQAIKTTQTLNFSNIAPGQSTTTTFTILGVEAQSSCNCNPVGAIEMGLKWNCYVNASNSVTIQISNLTTSAINPVSRDWNIMTIK